MESAPKNWNLRDRGTGAQQFRGLVMSHRRSTRRYKFEFSFVGNDRRPSQKSGTRRENRNAPAPILQICPCPSQTIGDIYDFEFSLVGKIGDSRETVKSTIVWDCPDIWKPGFHKTIYQGRAKTKNTLNSLVFWVAIHVGNSFFTHLSILIRSWSAVV